MCSDSAVANVEKLETMSSLAKVHELSKSEYDMSNTGQLQHMYAPQAEMSSPSSESIMHEPLGTSYAVRSMISFSDSVSANSSMMTPVEENKRTAGAPPPLPAVDADVGTVETEEPEVEAPSSAETAFTFLG